MWPFTRTPSPVRVSGDKLYLIDNDFGTEDPERLAVIRQGFIEQHLRALPRELQDAWRAGTHPAQDHRFMPQARKHADDLHRELAPCGYVNEVMATYFQDDRIVLSVILKTLLLPPTIRGDIPWLYRGFETKCMARGS